MWGLRLWEGHECGGGWTCYWRGIQLELRRDQHSHVIRSLNWLVNFEQFCHCQDSDCPCVICRACALCLNVLNLKGKGLYIIINIVYFYVWWWSVTGCSVLWAFHLTNLTMCAYSGQWSPDVSSRGSGLLAWKTIEYILVLITGNVFKWFGKCKQKHRKLFNMVYIYVQLSSIGFAAQQMVHFGCTTFKNCSPIAHHLVSLVSFCIIGSTDVKWTI